MFTLSLLSLLLSEPSLRASSFFGRSTDEAARHAQHVAGVAKAALDAIVILDGCTMGGRARRRPLRAAHAHGREGASGCGWLWSLLRRGQPSDAMVLSSRAVPPADIQPKLTSA